MQIRSSDGARTRIIEWKARGKSATCRAAPSLLTYPVYFGIGVNFSNFNRREQFDWYIHRADWSANNRDSCRWPCSKAVSLSFLEGKILWRFWRNHRWRSVFFGMVNSFHLKELVRPWSCPKYPEPILDSGRDVKFLLTFLTDRVSGSIVAKNRAEKENRFEDIAKTATRNAPCLAST